MSLFEKIIAFPIVLMCGYAMLAYGWIICDIMFEHIPELVSKIIKHRKNNEKI